MAEKIDHELVVNAFNGFVEESGLLFINVEDIREGEEFQIILDIVTKLRPFVQNIKALEVNTFNVVQKATEGLARLQRLGTDHRSIPQGELGAALTLLKKIQGGLSELEGQEIPEFAPAVEEDVAEQQVAEPDNKEDGEGATNLLSAHKESFASKEGEDYKGRYQEVEAGLLAQADMAANYTTEAQNVLILLAKIFKDLEARSDDDFKGDKEQFLGTLVLLEKALNIQKKTLRGSTRGVAEDILSKVNGAAAERASKLKERWQSIIEKIGSEAQKSTEESVESYSDEKRAMMREIVDRFGSLDLDKDESVAALDLLENILNVPQSGNLRTSRFA